MSDAYGMITFSKSVDCVVDLENLKLALNQYEWDSSGAKWNCSDSGILYIADYAFDRPQYPTAIPKEVEYYEMFDKVIDGRNTFYQKAPDLMTEEDWDAMAGEISQPVTLQKLSVLISPYLKSGWIEISCVANEKARYVYFEQLRIYADGKACSKRTCSGPFIEAEDMALEYCPESIAA